MRARLLTCSFAAVGCFAFSTRSLNDERLTYVRLLPWEGILLSLSLKSLYRNPSDDNLHRARARECQFD